MKETLKKFVITFIFLLLFNSSVCAGDSTESWNTITIKHKLNDQFTYILNGTERIRDNAGEHEYWELRTGFSYDASDYWSFAVYYLHGESKNTANKWIDENRFESDAVYKWNLGEFKWSNRLRYAYKNVNGIDWSQYRNKIKVVKPTSVFNQPMAAFVDNEMFYNDNVDRYNENRAKFGLSKKINDNVSGTLYYMYRANKGVNDWSGVNVVGTAVKFSL